MQLGTLRQQNQQTNSRIEAMKRAGGEKLSEVRNEKLEKACKDFQAILIKKMLDSMRDTVQETGLLDGGHAEKVFEDMLYKEYAQKMSETAGLGLDEMIYRELTGKAPGAATGAVSGAGDETAADGSNPGSAAGGGTEPGGNARLSGSAYLSGVAAGGSQRSGGWPAAGLPGSIR